MYYHTYGNSCICTTIRIVSHVYAQQKLYYPEHMQKIPYNIS